MPSLNSQGAMIWQATCLATNDSGLPDNTLRGLQIRKEPLKTELFEGFKALLTAAFARLLRTKQPG